MAVILCLQAGKRAELAAKLEAKRKALEAKQAAIIKESVPGEAREPPTPL